MPLNNQTKPNVSHNWIMHTLFHEQAVCGRDTKWEKAYLISLSHVALPFPDRVNVSTVQRTKAKRGQEWVSKLSCDTLWSP